MAIYELTSYKDILNQSGREGPKRMKGFYRKLSEHLNVHPTFVSQVLAGEKHFSEEQLLEACFFLGIEDRELDYTLLRFKQERAGSHSLNKFYEAKILDFKKETLLKFKKKDIEKILPEADTARFYSDWKYSAVHMMSTLQRKPNLSDILNRLELDRQEATKIINFLLETGMVLEKNFKYHEGVSKTILTKTSPYLIQHLTNWRIKALADLSKKDESEITFSTNFTISKKDFETLRKQIVALVNSFMPLIDASPAEELAYLNIDLRLM